MTIQLTDGTEVQVENVGDEHMHWLRAADGSCYTLEGDVYIRQDLGVLNARRQERLAAKNSRRRAIYASTSDGLGKKGTMSLGACPSIGKDTIPVVMVQFSDTKFKSTTTVDKMMRYYNEEGYNDEDDCVGSVRDYFIAQSGGQFSPTFDVVGIVTLTKSYSYYGTNNRQGYDQHLDELPGDVIEAAINSLGVDFSKYVVPAGDEKHAEGVPLMAMLYAGKGEATESQTTTNGKLIWPCEWDAEEDINQGDYQGVHFNSFFVGNELNTGGRALMGMGVFCHEFGHALGLPDFYCTDYSYSYDDAFSLWSIMDCGAYVADSYAPIGYTAYEKSYMGWLELPELTGSEVILHTPEGTADSSAFILRNSSVETFIFENRQPGTWYPSSFGSGVMVSRICYNQTNWRYNTPNNTQSKKRALMLTADGEKMYYSASLSNLYGNSKNAINTLKTYDGTIKTIDIKAITKKTDGTIALTLKDDDTGGETGGDVVVPVTGDYLFYESFDQCDGTGGNDGLWSGSIASKSLNPDNDGWTSGSDKGYGADRCAKFGTSNVAGSATTPSFQLAGSAELTFRAGAWNGKDSSSLEIVSEDVTINPSSFTMEKGSFSDYTATIHGRGNVKLKFEGGGRFFLDEVKVMATTTKVREIQTEPTHTGRIYTIDGRYAGTDLKVLPKGLYVMNGKKVVKI